jgi:hypothetical protein
MNLHHNEIYSIEQEGRFFIVTYRTIDGIKDAVFQTEKEAQEFAYSLN